MEPHHMCAIADRFDVEAEVRDDCGDPLGAMVLRHNASVLRARAALARRRRRACTPPRRSLMLVWPRHLPLAVA